MNSSVVSWMSPPIVTNPLVSMDEWDNVDYNFANFDMYSCNNMLHQDSSSSAAPIILSFGGNPMEGVEWPELFVRQCDQYSVRTAEKATTVIRGNKVQAKKRKRVRPPSQSYDHIMAERRRREQLSRLFVALSALVPGLKKMDKGSVLEDAIKYLKHLKDRVQTLEDAAKRNTTEPAVSVRILMVEAEDEASSDGTTILVEQQLPEIHVRACENQVLLRVHCEKRKGVLVELLRKVETLNMSVVNTNATPFGDAALDITIVAELEKDFDLTMKEIVVALRETLQGASTQIRNGY